MICSACYMNIDRYPITYEHKLGNGCILYYCPTCETLQKLGIIDSVGSLLIGDRDASA